MDESAWESDATAQYGFTRDWQIEAIQACISNDTLGLRQFLVGIKVLRNDWSCINR
jgi:hypothetical protein